MPKSICLLLVAVLLITLSCNRSGLKKYYTRISPEEFSSYKDVSIAVQSKYGKVYHVHQTTDRGFRDAFFVFEKIVNGEKQGLFKMDEFTQIKNDSTFLFTTAPLKMVGDTSVWTNGIWFYSAKKGATTTYAVDSMPKNPPKVDPNKMSMGIYYYQNQKLVKVSGRQSDSAFDELNKNGFFYLPNPGYFFMLANFNQIK
jgi:hypothetical protein